jgi:hypothetical protein
LQPTDPLDLFKMFFGGANPHIDGAPFLSTGPIVIEVGHTLTCNCRAVPHSVAQHRTVPRSA